MGSGSFFSTSASPGASFSLDEPIEDCVRSRMAPLRFVNGENRLGLE